MRTDFGVDVSDELEAEFKRSFADEDLNDVMTALLKRAALVRQFYESDEAMLSALRDGTIQFSPVRVR